MVIPKGQYVQMVKDDFLMVFEHVLVKGIYLIGIDGIAVVLFSVGKLVETFRLFAQLFHYLFLFGDVNVLVDDMFMGNLKTDGEQIAHGKLVVFGGKLSIDLVGGQVLLCKLVQVFNAEELCFFIPYLNSVVGKINVGQSGVFRGQREVFGIKSVFREQVVIIHYFGGHQSGGVDKFFDVFDLTLKIREHRCVHKFFRNDILQIEIPLFVQEGVGALGRIPDIIFGNDTDI